MYDLNKFFCLSHNSDIKLSLSLEIQMFSSEFLQVWLCLSQFWLFSPSLYLAVRTFYSEVFIFHYSNLSYNSDLFLRNVSLYLTILNFSLEVWIYIFQFQFFSSVFLELIQISGLNLNCEIKDNQKQAPMLSVVLQNQQMSTLSFAICQTNTLSVTECMCFDTLWCPSSCLKPSKFTTWSSWCLAV